MPDLRTLTALNSEVSRPEAAGAGVWFPLAQRATLPTGVASVSPR